MTALNRASLSPRDRLIVALDLPSVAALGVDLTTVHSYPQTMRAAAQGKEGSRLRIVAVTILTSYDEADCLDAGYSGDVASLVKRRVEQMCKANLDGVVCAATEAATVRALLGPEQLIVTPGIRPAGADVGDQKRVVTPRAAIAAGADLLVVGRPVTGAPDPRRAAQEIVEEIASAL